MSGWAVFHMSTTLSIPGTQDQNVSSTFWLVVELPEPELQAARRLAPRTTAMSFAPSASFMCSHLIVGTVEMHGRRGFCPDRKLSLRWTGSSDRERSQSRPMETVCQ